MAPLSFLKSSFDRLYQKIIHIEDTPHRIALGVAIGLVVGIMPMAGPLAAVVIAYFLGANRVIAFTAGLLTNTWVSFLTLVVAVKIGCAILGKPWLSVYEQIEFIIEQFSWKRVFSASVFDIVIPIMVGYAVLAVVLGVAAYLIAVSVVKARSKFHSPVARTTRL